MNKSKTTTALTEEQDVADIENIKVHLLRHKMSVADIKYDSEIVKQNIINRLGLELSKRVTFIKIR